MEKAKVVVNYRWTTKGSCGGYRWFASGTCNRKQFKAERRWKGNINPHWVIEDERFTLKERQEIGKAINAPERLREARRRAKRFIGAI